MSLPDSNVIVRAYLVSHADIIAFFAPDSPRIYSPRAPENAAIPNITIFVRGGTSTPYIPDIPSPSLQIDCWHNSSFDARKLYLIVYSALQGIQNVTVGSNMILSAIEEVHGQDLVDTDIPGRFRVLSFWEIMIK